MTVATVASASSRAPARQSRPTAAQMGRSAPQPARGRVVQGSAGRQGPRGPAGAPGPRRQQPRPSRQPKQKPKQKTRRREAARRLTGAATRPGSELHNYQAIVAVEFVGAVLLAAIAPFSYKTPQPTVQKPQSVSPYQVGDIIKIFAIGVVYMILEFLAAGPRGLARFSAWFGFLIFLAVGLSELAHIGDIFKTISGAKVSPTVLTASQAPASPGGTWGNPPLGQGTPPKKGA